MSFRLRLILSFAVLALLQAGLFTALSDQLIRDGLEGEATARLGLVSRLLPQAAPAADWPHRSVPEAARALWERSLAAYASRYQLARAVLLLPGQVLDSQGGRGRQAEDWWAADGLRAPQGQGDLKISGPLFKAEDGWRKVLYTRLGSGAWLRLEAGTPFLGQVAALQKRLLRLSTTLAIPALLAGLGLGWLLSRRARALEARLAQPEQGVQLKGRDEFARISVQVQKLLDSLAQERERAAGLNQAKLHQAHEMARGVAHELRNPMAGLSLLSEVLLRRQKEGAPAAELADLGTRFQAELARLEATVARFMDFARTPELQPQALDLGEAAREAARGLVPQPALEGHAQALADPKALRVILGVILGNAAESAGALGALRFSLSQDAGRARLTLWDSGAPVEEGLRPRMFTPFFTTKAKGLGLGLATAASLAGHMHGSLNLLEDGKTFELLLPLA